MHKFMCLFQLGAGVILTYIGFKGTLSSYIGGLAWLLLTIYAIADYIEIKRSEKFSSMIIKTIEEQKRKEKVSALKPEGK